MNTFRNGAAQMLILENPKTNKYLGVIYEFAIVLESDNKEELKKDLIDAAKGYLEVARQENMSEGILNKSYMLPRTYRELFEEFRTRLIIGKSTQKLPKEFEDAISTGRANIGFALPLAA